MHYIFMKFNDKMIIELHEYLSFHFVSCRCCGSKQSFENDDSFHDWSVLYSCRLMNFVVPFGHRLILITDEIKVNGDEFMDESRNIGRRFWTWCLWMASSDLELSCKIRMLNWDFVIMVVSCNLF